MVAEDVSILCVILKLFGSMSANHFLHEHLLKKVAQLLPYFTEEY